MKESGLTIPLKGILKKQGGFDIDFSQFNNLKNIHEILILDKENKENEGLYVGSFDLKGKKFTGNFYLFHYKNIIFHCKEAKLIMKVVFYAKVFPDEKPCGYADLHAPNGMKESGIWNGNGLIIQGIGKQELGKNEKELQTLAKANYRLGRGQDEEESAKNYERCISEINRLQRDPNTTKK